MTTDLTKPTAGNQGADLLLRALREPAEIRGLSLREWDLLLPGARTTRLLPHLAWQMEESGMLEDAPRPVLLHLKAARVVGERAEQQLQWEMGRIKRALGESDTPIVLLKATAYASLGLLSARGRLHNDIDLLLPEQALESVAERLMKHGWEASPLPPRQQWYFRRWMHELPLMTHPDRGTKVDLHHNILPRIDPLYFDPDTLFRNALPSPTDPRFLILSPVDRVLHGAVNLFRHGDYHHGLRDLFDLKCLLNLDGSDPEFWTLLVQRAQALSLLRPLFLACHYVTKFLGMRAPPHARRMLARGKPIDATLRLMDRLVTCAVLPPRTDRGNRRREFCLRLLSRYPLCLWRRSILPKAELLLGVSASRQG